MPPRVTRRAALAAAGMLPLALSGCDFLDDLFEPNKPPIPGQRSDVGVGNAALTVDAPAGVVVTLPPVQQNPDWPQQGRDPTHVQGNLAGGLTKVWSNDIGEGAGYRRRYPCPPIVAAGRVYTMDPAAVIAAFDAASGREVWRTPTRAKKDRSSNIGGGITFQDGRVYVATGRGDLLSLDAATGAVQWRAALGAPGRSAPTVAGSLLVVPLSDGRLQAYAIADGNPGWSYQAQITTATVLGEPAPAFKDGIVVAGFGSGDLVGLRVDSGSVAWADSLASPTGRDSPADFSAITALPVIAGTTVIGISLGALMLALDLRSGRHLWDRPFSGGSTPWIAGDWMFVLGIDQRLLAMTWADGKIRWIAQLPRFNNPTRLTYPIFWTGPVLANGRLILGSNRSRLLVIDAVSGKEIEEVKLSDAVSTPPVIAGGLLYLLTDDGTLTAYR